MKIVNWLENSIIAVVVTIACFFILNELKFKPMQKQYEKQAKVQSELIEELSKIEKYSIENTFDKIKSKGGNTAINLESTMQISQKDSVNLSERKTFFKNLFNR